MQPQNAAEAGSSQSLPNPDYNFIMGDGQPAKSSKLTLPNLPKPALLLVGLLAVLVVGIIIVVVASNGGNTTNYTSLMARSQEIVRVSGVVKAQTKNADTLSLIATTESALSSEQAQLSNYLAANGTKVNTKSLALYLNKDTDAQMTAALQNNNLDAAYASYVKNELTKYRQELSSTYKSAGKNAKPILQEAFDSTKALLSSPQLK